ncbi:TetR/AcrR family transcriptional regulator [Enterobacter hormaechei]|uniref:TetR/AcrR family transcriptional regulator n=1 Tax=Enterobacter hormaechei TaxID=158836 RepID=UPI0027394223|nr:TetR/AcrR family transcriptional regulator [Enterobacter hormaechei]MDZ5681144.1 TetR/AcrR family transcriptional regulator [Enterobacter hormaechei]WLP09793.1 TetR/AcrR family transcriptional regulator [Enterobacter hormaechei]HCD9773819.1 TetR/AcrR family transcriptional regulator [Enterobacter hormaechei]HCE3973284.1 TetR/AcrR family transcriptional regulator [Enterobacter hormaechei]
MRTLTEKKRTDILNAATTVFLEQGYERASMDGVARAAECSKATLYNYFSSKEMLLDAVVRAYGTNFLTRAADEICSQENRQLPLSERLQSFGEGMLGTMTSDWKGLQLYRMVVGEAGHSRIGDIFYESGVRESMNALATLMEQHIEDGDLIPFRPDLRAKQFSALVKAEADELFLLHDMPVYTREDIAVMVKNAVDLFLSGASLR